VETKQKCTQENENLEHGEQIHALGRTRDEWSQILSLVSQGFESFTNILGMER
jgi:hypothetical protein